MLDCLFCRIIENEIPAQRIYENDSVIIIKDINPQAPIHYLAIPKKHYAGIHEIPPAETNLISDLFSAIGEIVISEGLSEKKGYRLVINFGVCAGQAVHHIHIHMLSGRDLQWPPG